MGKLTETKIKKLIDEIIVIQDTREKGESNHITKCFDEYGVNWKKEQLVSGDYSAILPQNDEYNTPEIDLRDELCIERKMSCDEVIRNLTVYRERFSKEFKRSDATIPILIEDSFENACKGKYRSKVTPNQFLGALFSFCVEHNTYFYFMEDKELSARWIYDQFKYRIRHKLKNMKV